MSKLITKLQHNLLHAPPYQWAAVLTSFGGFLFGIDTGTIGPITTMGSYINTFGHFSSTVHGLVISSMLIGGTISGLFAGSIADIYGRVPSIIAGAATFGIGAVIECAAPFLGMFILGRVICGVGMGLFLGTLMVYVLEITPASKRGPLASLIQYFITTGLACGYFISYGTARIANSSAAWRMPLAIQAGIVFAFSIACLKLPPSPRWLMAKHRTDEALLVLDKLGLETTELELVTSRVSIDRLGADTSLLENIKGGLRDIGRVFSKGARRQTALGCFLMAMQQFSGIDGVLYYAPLLFQQAGLASTEASFLASGVSALVIFAATIPATIYSDKWGRRTSAIVGGVAMTLLMVLVGSLYAGKVVFGDHGVARWVVVVCIYLFGIAFSTTWAVSLRIYSGEIQPAKTRASATSLAQSANWMSNFVVALITPILLAKSSFAAYYLFGGCTLVTVFVCMFWMPETKGKSLEAIDQSFSEKQSSMVKLGSVLRRKSRLNNGKMQSDNERNCETSGVAVVMVD